jgi:cardiolipin synthase
MHQEMWDGWVVATVLGTDAALRIVIAFRVILRRLSVPPTLAWLLLLLFVPVASWLIYLLVGEPRLGSRRAARYELATRRIEEDAVLRWARAGWTYASDEEPYSSLARLGTSVSGIPPLIGNVVELLGTGTPVLKRLIEDIDQAVDHVHMLYYIWQPTGTTEAVADALIRAAKRGVQCRVLVDAVGSRRFLLSSMRKAMEEAGVCVAEALPVNPFRMLLARVDLRNHRKISVIDGGIAYCGSQNLTDETFRFRRRKRTGPWIDATVRIRGPASQALQAVFMRDWVMECEDDLRNPERYMNGRASPLAQGCPVHVLPSGPGPQAEAMRQLTLAMLFAAREEIIITTAYFVPDEATQAALINAAMRGVDVTLVLPDVLDARVVAAASRAHYEDLLVAGVRIVHHEEGLLHAKTATVDRRIAMLGSANLDMRSFWLNFEATLFVYDSAFASTLRFMQRHYMNEGRPISLRAWRRRPIVRRLVDNTAQLLSPLL